MTRNFKAMGLALLCVFALGAIGAHSASAAVEHTFTSSSGTDATVLTATTEPGTKEVFGLTSGKVECEDITYRATVSTGPVDHVAVVPIYTNAHCTIPGLGKVAAQNNGCTYTFDSDTFENATHFPAGQEHANVSLTCGHTGAIVVTGAGCTITVGDTHAGGVSVNQSLPGARFAALPKHSGEKTGMTVSSTVKTIKATSMGANCVLCGLGSNGTHVNGTYDGKGIITGYEDPALKNPHTETLSEGSLVDLGLTTP